MVGISNKEAPLRLLSLDGGGVRGVSELVILRQLMLQVQREGHLPTMPKPCEVFDLIGGTSTGGLIAIMLGRLRMSVDQAIEEYRVLAKEVFGEKKPFFSDGSFKATNLQKAIQSVVQRYDSQGGPDARLMQPGSEHEGCKIFVCTKNAMGMKSARLLRSYPGYSSGDYPDITIWEAARATSAAPTFFKSLRMGPPGMQEEFIDGGMGCNNPTTLLLQEAARVFGPNRRVACVVSIGTGLKPNNPSNAPQFLQKVIPVDTIKAVVDTATDCEETHSSMERRFSHVPDLYFRFNADQPVGEIGLDEWKEVGKIAAYTEYYLKHPAVNAQANKAAVSLCNDALGKCPASILGM